MLSNIKNDQLWTKTYARCKGKYTTGKMRVTEIYTGLLSNES